MSDAMDPVWERLREIQDDLRLVRQDLRDVGDRVTSLERSKKQHDVDLEHAFIDIGDRLRALEDARKEKSCNQST